MDEDTKDIVRYVYDAYVNHKIELLNGSDCTLTNDKSQITYKYK